MSKIENLNLPLRLTEDNLIKQKGSNTAIGEVYSEKVGKLIIEAVNNYPKLRHLVKDITDLK